MWRASRLINLFPKNLVKTLIMNTILSSHAEMNIQALLVLAVCKGGLTSDGLRDWGELTLPQLCQPAFLLEQQALPSQKPR